MFGSEVLEIGIGIVFVIIFLSLVSTTVTESIARILKLRSGTLQDGIRNLLNDPEGSGLAGKLYKHPLIERLGRQGKGTKSADELPAKRAGRPSYVPSRVFAAALFDVIAPAEGSHPKAVTPTRITTSDSRSSRREKGTRRSLASAPQSSCAPTTSAPT